MVAINKILAVFFHYWAMESARGTRFLLGFMLGLMGAVTYFCLPFEPSFISFVSLICVGVVALIGVWHWPRASWLLQGGLCFLLGFMAAKVETWRVDAPQVGVEISTTLTGRLTDLEVLPKGGSRLLLMVLSTKSPELYHAPRYVRLTARRVPADLHLGDVVVGRVHLRAPNGPLRPAGYDFGFYNYFKRLGGLGFYFQTPQKIGSFFAPSLWQRAQESFAFLRINMAKTIEHSIGGQAGKVAAALITGQRAGIDDSTNKALRIAGLAHILSISGLHMAMVSGMVMLVIRSILACFLTFSAHYPIKKIAALGALGTAAFYLLLSGVQVAATRSFIMVAVMLLAILGDRPALTMRNLAIAGWICILFTPHEVMGPSFQMSFSATAALIASFGVWRSWHLKRSIPEGAKFFVPPPLYWRVGRFILASASSTAGASIVAGAASGIFAAYHFANIAPLGLISNILALPVMSLVVMPSALLASVVMPFGLADTPLTIVGLGVEIILNIARFVSTHSPDIHLGFMPLSALGAFSFALAILVFFKTRLRLFFLPVFAFGLGLCWWQPKPLVLVAENGKLVGAVADKTLYVDRSRPSLFTTNIWRTAFSIPTVIPPLRKVNESMIELPHQFHCHQALCQARLFEGIRLAVLENSKKYAPPCTVADIIVDLRLRRGEECEGFAGILITREALVRRGSVIIWQNGRVEWAYPFALRPWTAYRRYAVNALKKAVKLDGEP